jgi:putative alpha-1,2-mannosidase
MVCACRHGILLATPLFERSTLRLGAPGATLVISALGLSPENRYIQSATLNGRPWEQARLRHSDMHTQALRRLSHRISLRKVPWCNLHNHDF